MTQPTATPHQSQPKNPISGQPHAAARRERLAVFGAVFVPALALYLWCLPSTISRGGDGGELVSASYLLGIAHPTGYPFFCLLGRLWAALCPLGEVAWRYNLLSALAGAGACGLVAITVHRLTYASTARRAIWAAVGAGLLLAGFYFFATQAIIAEVYALNALVLSLLLLCAIAWHQDVDWRWFYSLAALSGLALVTHLSCVFVFPGLLLFTVSKQWPRFGGAMPAAKRIAGAGGLAAAVAALCLYLPLRAGLFPAPPRAQPVANSVYWPLDWGHPTNVSRLRAHVTAEQYRHLLFKPGIVHFAGRDWSTRTLAQPLSKLPSRLETFATFLVLQYLWLTPLVLVGAVAAFRDRALGWFLLLVFGANVGVELNYNVGDQSNFFFPAYLVMAIWMGLGLYTAAAWGGQVQGLWGWRLRTGAKLALPGTIFLQWTLFAGAAMLRGSTLPVDVARDQINGVESLQRQGSRPSTVFLFNDDLLWPFWYVHFVEHRAPGIWTPWGKGLKLSMEKGALPTYVSTLQNRGAVFFGQWREDVDARFPFIPTGRSDTLWLASRRALPLPATPIRNATTESSTAGVNGLVSARFRRIKLWRVVPNGTPRILRGSLTAFEVDFIPQKAFLAHAKATPARVEQATQAGYQAGYIEVLIAPAGKFTGMPSPAQKAESEGSGDDASVIVSLQRRRLILPENARPGQLLRAVVPIEAENTARSALYEVYTRLIPPDAKDATLWKWTLTDRAHWTHK